MFAAKALRAALAALLVTLAQPAGAQTYVAGTDDVPLMPGLAPVAGSSLVFDKPEGRIVKAEAKGTVSRDKVLAFYGASLPELGWHGDGDGAWQRDDEHLHLDFSGRDGDLIVGFTLSPN